MSAFDMLYERHLPIAHTVARRNVDNPSDAEDIVAEAFHAVLQNLVAGKGPDNFFRAYLLSTITRLSHHRNRKAGKTLPIGDDSVLDSSLAEPDAAVKAFESHTVAKAFRSLPERWQAVLWYLDVEGMKPAAVAPMLGLTANAVSALALRAREGLRRQYLQAHVAEEPSNDCAGYVSKLGNFIRGGLSSASERKVREHLTGCSKCTRALSELKDIQGSMRAALLPLITGIPLAAWVGQGAGLGALGGLVPVKAAIVVPAIAQPAVMAMIATAGLGLVLGTVGIVDHLRPDAYMEEPTVVTSSSQQSPTAVPFLPAPAAETPSSPVPASSVPVEPAPPVVVPEPPVEISAQEVAEPPVGISAQPGPETPSSPVPSSPAMTPSKDPLGAVTASAEDTGERSNTTAVQVDFSVSGSHPLGPGKAVFSVRKNARIEEGSLVAPEGWSCSLADRNVATCFTDSVQRGDLHFRVVTASKGQSDGVLTYSLSGTGLAPGEFVYNY
ncbi:sigma-70 family RNA polymerase sigma factor [Paenarthrobacter sp. NPDC092416]|uniref:sigma-70 family RNA polymerase sigma factor n=1 Tax=Paenarthrobacter sp. NPDC092416 TaxID=3364386 RepID=UPI0038199F6E